MSNVLIFPDFTQSPTWFEPFDIDQAIAKLKVQREEWATEQPEQVLEHIQSKLSALQFIKDKLMDLSETDRWHLIHCLMRISSDRSTSFVVEISRERMPKNVLDETLDSSYMDMNIELSLLISSYYEDCNNPYFSVTKKSSTSLEGV